MRLKKYFKSWSEKIERAEKNQQSVSERNKYYKNRDKILEKQEEIVNKIERYKHKDSE